MTDLRKGIIEINGFEIGPQTTIDSIERYMGINAEHLSSGSIVLEFCGTISGFSEHFNITMWCRPSVNKIELRPILPEIAAKYNLSDYSNDWLPYYKEIRAILDEWLEKQLGKPTRKNERKTTYEYDGIVINTCAYIDERSRDYFVHGGALRVWYGL